MIVLPGLLVAVIYLALVLACIALAVAGWLLWQRHRPHPDDPLPSLADPREVATMTLPGVAALADKTP